jgi:flavin reductase (DIM6/NTAB) family NADH-FMN oxidoreductase RutF
MVLNNIDISNLERRYRGNFINSLGGFKSAVLVGTKSAKGAENLAIFSSLFHIGADPALCGIIVRPTEEKQNTLGNIIDTQYFTINHIHAGFYKQAHQSSAKYDDGINEFEQVGLSAEYLPDLNVPLVKESKIKFVCNLVQKVDIELNGTILIIGKIINAIVPTEIVNADGYINIEAAGTVTVSGLDAYHTTTKLSRLSYAKPDKLLHEIWKA